MYKTDPNRWPKYLLLSFIYKAVLKSSTTTAEEKQHIQIVIYFFTPPFENYCGHFNYPIVIAALSPYCLSKLPNTGRKCFIAWNVFMYTYSLKSFFRFQIKLEPRIEFLRLICIYIIISTCRPSKFKYWLSSKIYSHCVQHIFILVMTHIVCNESPDDE